MPTAVPDSIARLRGRTGRNLVAMRRLVVLTTMLLPGCAGMSSLLQPPHAAVEIPPDDGEPAGAASRVPSTPAKADPTVVRASAVVQAEASQSPPALPTGPARSGLPDLSDGDQPDPAASVDVTAPFLGQPGPSEDGPTLYRYDPMRGAALSRTPPANRNITLRELLGLGRSDIADQEVEARPKYPRLHDDPLAGSPVPPAERDRPILPWLSNLFFEHNRELNEDADDARDDVLERRSKHNVTYPGPDTANFPNSAFTLPKGRAYIETSPVTFFGKSGNNSFAAQYNWEFLFRYGLTDDLEFRFFSSGYSLTLSKKPPTSGFSPVVFDFKYHMWDENLDKHIPAAGVEIYIQTPFGSNYFNGGTQPSIALLLDHTLPFDILLEHNFGLTGIEDTFGGAVYEFSYQWALQRQVFKDFAIFTHGFLNSAGLPRTPIFQRHVDSRALTVTPGVEDQQSDDPSAPPKKPVQVLVGVGFLWNWSMRLSLYGSYNWGLTPDSPKTLALMGFAVAF